MKKTLLIIISIAVMAMTLTSCYSERAGYGKSGCGSYDGWNAHTKYRIKGKN